MKRRVTNLFGFNSSMRRVPYQFLLRYAGNVVRARLRRGPNRKLLPPMTATLYVTTKCNFRCTYCDDGSGNLYPDIQINRLDTQQTIELLRILRRAAPGLNITGGEPTIRSDIDRLFEEIDVLGFSPVTFNTNAYELDRHLTILRHIDFLVVSLDSIDEKRGDALINLPRRGQTDRVKRNLQLATAYREKYKLKFDFIINTVILPETIDDAWEVFGFCLDNDFYWTPMPYIIGKYPCPGLVDNPRWQDLINEVVRAKANGARVCGNVKALLTIRDFTRFECYPTTHPTIYPRGDLHYPCLPLNKVAGNLLQIRDYNETVKLGQQIHGPVPSCDSRCHIACHTESSTAISHPTEGAKELLRYLLRRSKQSFVLQRPQQQYRTLPPNFQELRQSPSLPPDQVRQLRSDGMIENDWSSKLRVKHLTSLSKLKESELHQEVQVVRVK